jgi:hypothetical protein
MTFKESDFHTEIIRFRELMGSKEWWNKSLAQRDACIRGLSILYLNINNDNGSAPTQEQMNEWAFLLDATLTEYSKRAIMLGKEI